MIIYLAVQSERDRAALRGNILEQEPNEDGTSNDYMEQDNESIIEVPLAVPFSSTVEEQLAPIEGTSVLHDERLNGWPRFP